MEGSTEKNLAKLFEASGLAASRRCRVCLAVFSSETKNFQIRLVRQNRWTNDVPGPCWSLHCPPSQCLCWTKWSEGIIESKMLKNLSLPCCICADSAAKKGTERATCTRPTCRRKWTLVKPSMSQDVSRCLKSLPWSSNRQKSHESRRSLESPGSWAESLSSSCVPSLVTWHLTHFVLGLGKFSVFLFFESCESGFWVVWSIEQHEDVKKRRLWNHALTMLLHQRCWHLWFAQVQIHLQKRAPAIFTIFNVLKFLNWNRGNLSLRHVHTPCAPWCYREISACNQWQSRETTLIGPEGSNSSTKIR